MIWDASDANPMHRRIPAEVVSRRAYAKKPPQERDKFFDDVIVDLKAAIVLKPDARPKWLGKACKMVMEGRASSTDLFDIIVSRKFASGLPERVRRKLMSIIMESRGIFSDNQQRYLGSSESPLTSQLPTREVAGDADGEDVGMGKDSSVVEEDMVERHNDSSHNHRTFSEVQQTDRTTQERQEIAEEGAAKWQVAKDEAALRRHRRETEEIVRRQAARREERQRKLAFEEEAAKQQATDEEAAKRRKLEEEADNIFNRALVPQPTTNGGSSRANDDRTCSRSVSAQRSGGSRSISSRTARRRLRSRDKNRRRSWQSSLPPGGVLSGSRAIFMNRDFVEDLPHLPRPPVPGTQVAQSRFGSRSRERSRRRSRRRSKSIKRITDR